ncbi:MAG: hypothetical protein LBL87_01705 [Ruminococcus sp.]|jgi:RNA polymerase subunit RPABC4/transcription elongation factor Spt4|nr:hypothetical protein [Ruminococcus sp.]
MQNDGFTEVITPAGVSPICNKCRAKWEDEREICPWCGADKSGNQIQPLKFHIPKIKNEKSEWHKDRSVPVPVIKAIVILLLSALFGAVLYFLMPIIFTLTLLLKNVLIILCVFAIACVGISFGVTAIFKRLINVWGKGNNMGLCSVTSLIIFAPYSIGLTIAYWKSGAVAGIMSLLLGIVIPILGIVGIGIFVHLTTSGKFCPHCSSNVYLRNDAVVIHSCNTEELIKRINSDEPKDALKDLDVPAPSKYAYTAVDLYICKNPDCRHAEVNVYQHMMREYYDKQNSQMQADDRNRLVARHEIAGDTYDSWVEDVNKKDPLA